MTRDEAKALLPIIQAYAEGKTIQTKKIKTDSTGLNEKWIDCINPELDIPGCYRVKPDPKYRPFRNAEECWQEMQRHQPFGWVMTDGGGRRTICSITSELYVSNQGVGYTFSEAFDTYTFADEHPFGMMEEENND